MIPATYKPAPSPVSFWERVSIPSRGIQLHEALHSGFSYSVFERLAEASCMEKKALAEALSIAPATLSRRAKIKQFNKDESDRLYRFAEVFYASLELFESDETAAQQWLHSPILGLGNKRPIELLTTSAETEAVLDLIGRLEHGVVA